MHEQVVLLPVADALHQAPQERSQLSGLKDTVAGGAHLGPHGAHKLHVAGDVLADAVQEIHHILRDRENRSTTQMEE